MKKRDTQRSRVLEAERLFGRQSALINLDVEDEDFANEILSKITARVRFRRAFPKWNQRLPEIRFRRKSAIESVAAVPLKHPDGVIHLSSRATLVDLTRCLAQCLLRRIDGADGINLPDSGPEYCQAQLLLVSLMFGAQAEKALRQAYRDQGVRIKHPTPRKISPERREKLRKKMRAVNLRKKRREATCLSMDIPMCRMLAA